MSWWVDEFNEFNEFNEFMSLMGSLGLMGLMGREWWASEIPNRFSSERSEIKPVLDNCQPGIGERDVALLPPACTNASAWKMRKWVIQYVFEFIPSFCDKAPGCVSDWQSGASIPWPWETESRSIYSGEIASGYGWKRTVRVCHLTLAVLSLMLLSYIFCFDNTLELEYPYTLHGEGKWNQFIYLLSACS